MLAYNVWSYIDSRRSNSPFIASDLGNTWVSEERDLSISKMSQSAFSATLHLCEKYADISMMHVDILSLEC